MTDAKQRPSAAPDVAPPAPGSEPALFGSAMAGAAQRTAEHFGGRNTGEPEGPPDAIELWGRRIGRALSLAVCLGLAIYLFATYVR